MLSIRCVHGVLRTLRQLAISMLLCPGQKEVSWMSRISFHEQKFKQNFPHFWAMLKAENAKRTGRNWPKPNHRAILQNPPMVRWCIRLTLVCVVTRYNWLKSEKNLSNATFFSEQLGLVWSDHDWIFTDSESLSISGTVGHGAEPLVTTYFPVLEGEGRSAGVALELILSSLFWRERGGLQELHWSLIAS